LTSEKEEEKNLKTRVLRDEECDEEEGEEEGERRTELGFLPELERARGEMGVVGEEDEMGSKIDGLLKDAPLAERD